MKINCDTKLFVSVSSHPGDFGATLYNSAFQELGINAIYKPLKCDYISQFVDIVRYAELYSIKGISVSMPFKRVAIDLGRLGDEHVVYCGSANTLVFDGKKQSPIAYNTDFIGFENANQEALKSARSAVVVGNGAVSESVRYVLDKYNVRYIIVSSRKDIEVKSDWLINCSCIGMEHVPDIIFNKNNVSQFKYVSDVVNIKETNLIKIAKELEKLYVNGVAMCLEGMCKQFHLYTGQEAPRKIFERALIESHYI